MPSTLMKVSDDLVISVSLEIKSEVPDKKRFLNEDTHRHTQTSSTKQPGLRVGGAIKNTTLEVR